MTYSWRQLTYLLGMAVILWPAATMAANEISTQFTNRGGISNTRHNLTQSTMQNSGGAVMNPYRNDYRQVCVYCHTPHGANTAAAAPLWNRLLPAASSFVKYSSASLTSSVAEPGAASLACLSCHDGQTSIDSILNMPGSGGYSASPNNAFLNTWSGGTKGLNHSRLGDELLQGSSSSGFTKCLTCHQPDALGGDAGATDFSVFVIGKRLDNDHPIGVTFPGGSPATTGFQSGYASQTQPNGKVITYYDADTNGRLSKQDPRFYDNKVECASCHDPHGVPSAGPNSEIFPTFLRVDVAGSSICLTCHAK